MKFFSVTGAIVLNILLICIALGVDFIPVLRDYATFLKTLFTLGAIGSSMLIWFAIDREGKDKKTRGKETLEALDSIGYALIVTDMYGKITGMNSTARKILGLKEEEVTGRSVQELFSLKDPITGDPAENPVKLALEKDDKIDVSHIILKASNGTKYDVEGVCIPLHQVRGNLSGAIMVFRDTTGINKRKHILSLLESSIDNTPEEILWLRNDGSILYANKAVCKSLGYTREELLYKSIHDITLHFPRSKWPAFLEKAKKKRYFPVEAIGRRRDGSTYYVEAFFSCMDFDGDRIFSLFARNITEQKETKEALEKEQAELRQYIDNHFTFTARLTSNGTLTMINRTAIDATGLSVKDLIGKAFPDTYWWTHDDRARNNIKEWIKRAAKGERIIEETTLRTRRGIRPVMFILSPVKDMYGNAQYIIAEAQDISKIKEAEDQLKKSYVLLNSISTFAGILDSDGRLEFVNERTIHILGYSKEDALNLQFWESPWIAPQSREEVKEAIKMALNGHVARKEITCFTSTGTKLPVIFSANPIFDDTGFITGVSVEGVDISELRDTESMYRTLFDASPEGIIVSDLKTHKNLYANAAINEMLGYTQEELKKIRMEDLYPEYVIEKLTSVTRSGTKIKKTLIEDIPITRKDGSIMDADIYMTSIYLNNMEIAIEFILDITEKKRLEKQVRQMQKMEAIGALAGGIAHDFNNILSPIMGYAELLSIKASDKEAVVRYANSIMQCSSRAKALVQQILTFSRKSDGEKRPILLQPILKETIKLLKSTFPSFIEIKQEISPDCGPVMANPVQIHQIIMNLCINASHAIGEKAGLLEITLKEEHLDYNDPVHTKFARLTVRDTGVGIPPNIQDRIFEPYFTTKGPEKGTGMGLAIVYGIVKESGGHIEVNSKLGKGTEFNIYLPLIEDQKVATEERSSDSIAKGTGRVMVVDDEEEITLMLEQMLESLGYDVSGRTSSIEALKLFEAKPHKFDLVITDMNMPNMNGLELISKLRKIREDIPIIICTGFSEQLTSEKIKAYRINKAIMKPVLLKDLSDAIREVLKDESTPQKKRPEGRLQKDS